MSYTDSIHMGNGKTKMRVMAFSFKIPDSDTFNMYCPSLKISAYGKNEKEAKEMMIFSLENFAMDFSELKPKQRIQALINLGWKKDAIKTKDYSRSFIDANGELQGFSEEAIEEVKEFEMCV